MMQRKTFALVAALMLACGGSAALAQSIGNTGPARADTTDPNSAPGRGMTHRGFDTRADVYARGKRSARVSHRAVRHRVARAPAAAKPDPAIEAQRNTALLLSDAMHPWAPTATTAAKTAKRR
jgi:hypothetical protein